MNFDQTSVLSLVKLALDKNDRRRTDDQMLAMSAACDEISLRMQSRSFVRSYTVSLAADDRETTLTGDNYDLKYIFALKFGTGDDQKVLIPQDEQQFLRDYDNPSETSGTPTYYTILEADDSGYPIVKYDCPLASADTLTVYYYIDITTDNISSARSITAIVAGTLAHFFGTKSERGEKYHNEFKEACALMRGADTFNINAPTELRLSRDDQAIRAVASNIRLNRS